MDNNLAKQTMKNEEKETQSRREFFKEAAKKALPLLGVVALMSNPVISKAVENENIGCNGYCSQHCSAGCANSCTGDCVGDCKNTCLGKCKGSCGSYCTQNCSSGCAHNLR